MLDDHVRRSRPDQRAPSAGGCTDNAGNSAPAPVSINYDATAPVLAKAVASTAGTARTSSAGRRRAHRTPRSSSAGRAVAKSSRSSSAGPAAASWTGRSRPGSSTATRCRPSTRRAMPRKRLVVAGLPKVLTLKKLPYVPRVSEQADPSLACRARCDVLQRPALPRVEARLRRVAGEEPARAARRLEVGGQVAPPGPGPLPLVRLGRSRKRSFARYRTLGSAQFIVPRPSGDAVERP